MRINHKILSIPPYISTSWSNVASLHVEMAMGAPLLIICLNSGERIEIPRLEIPIIEAIFHAHAKSLEQKESAVTSDLNMSFPLRFAMGGLEGMGTLLQHNPQQNDSPPLPSEILNKIAFLCKTIAPEDANALPDAEPHCNCMHCQISRAIHNGIEGMKAEAIPEDEEVSEKDLTFRTWDIRQESDKLFVVTNPLNAQEKYNVYLGDPVGCTCGEKTCDHIQAVLRT